MTLTFTKSVPLVLTLLFFSDIYAQNVDIPQSSQRGAVSQRLGLSYITIEYSSPNVRDRTIFGGLVPYGSPWGAGDRENTTIEFEHDALLEGQEIKAGKYGLFMIPNEDSFEILLSKYHESWSQTYPTEEETALKVSVAPQEIPLREWLTYDFIEKGGKSLTAALEWENTRVPFTIEILNPNDVLFESLKAEVKGRGQFLWGANYDAAVALFSRNIHLDQALEWVDASLDLEPKGNPNWRRGLSLYIKSRIIINKEGYNTEAKNLMHEAITLIEHPSELKRAVYILLENGETKKAIEAATKLVSDHSQHPSIWAFMDSLAETYLEDGNKEQALHYYKKAKSMAPENQHEYFDGVIASIENNND